ncbi:efflux transporter outer membrane subunit [Vogesella oryzae]|uniref:efflux transporter outer membrane subunit n=1 Tax=Vogesella oryzae TaxID=1735285 RepID=UPI001581F55A|nr:efflux transporter outer membrane subunit [Vogesella oryzae]
MRWISLPAALLCLAPSPLLAAGNADLPLQQDAWRQAAVPWQAPRSAVDWWQAFGSRTLPALQAQARAANPDLLSAQAVIARARATLAETAAGGSVQLGASASSQRSRGSTRSTSSQLGPTLSYSVDWWGQRAAQDSAAQARVVASEASRDATALTLDSEVARQYFSLLALQQQQQLASRQLAAMQQRSALLRQQVALGSKAPYELAALQQDIASQTASVATLSLSLQQAFTALAVLCGVAPQDFRLAGEALTVLQQPYPAAQQPSALLLQRPDIRAADATLQAAQADIAAARAALYPSFTLSWEGVLSKVAGGPSQWVTTAAAALAGTLYDGGKLRAGVRYSEAQWQVQLQAWRSTVLAAIADADNAMQAIAAYRQAMMALEAQLRAAEQQERAAAARYQLGAIDKATLLAQQESMLAVRQSWCEMRGKLLSASASLYEALGGAPLTQSAGG